MENKTEILIVDDEADIRKAVNVLLSKNDNFSVTEAASGLEAVDMISDGARFDIIVIDIIMPVMSGTEAAQRIRRMTDCPILFLTAKSADSDKTQAFSVGGDDYLCKPFSSVELMLRINALLKRCGNKTNDIRIDTAFRKVYKKDVEIPLTDREYDLLIFLYTHKGSAFSNSELYEAVWGEKYLSTSSNTVMVHILNLRKKIEDDCQNPKYIRTVWGKGYCYAG